METQLPRRFLAGAVLVPHRLGPQHAGRPVLGDLLEDVVVGVEEEAEPRREGVDVQAARQAGVDVVEAVGQREGQLLHGGRAGLADVVAADADRVPLRHMLRAQNSITSETRRTCGSGGKTNSFWAWNSLRMSFWMVPRSCFQSTPWSWALARKNAMTTMAGALMVIDTDTLARSMPSNSSAMSSSVSTATPSRPTSPRRGGRRCRGP